MVLKKLLQVGIVICASPLIVLGLAVLAIYLIMYLLAELVSSIFASIFTSNEDDEKNNNKHDNLFPTWRVRHAS